MNNYRVEAAKKRLTDPAQDRFTIVAIAESVGFNSKGTFYRAFKKQVQMTPSEYKKQHRQ